MGRTVDRGGDGEGEERGGETPAAASQRHLHGGTGPETQRSVPSLTSVLTSVHLFVCFSFSFSLSPPPPFSLSLRDK